MAGQTGVWQGDGGYILGYVALLGNVLLQPMLYQVTPSETHFTTLTGQTGLTLHAHRWAETESIGDQTILYNMHLICI